MNPVAAFARGVNASYAAWVAAYRARVRLRDPAAWRRGTIMLASDVPSWRASHLDLFVGGLSERDALGVAYHVRWRGRDLTVGSRVTVSIVDTGHPDPPVKRYRSDKEVQESSFTEEELKEMRRQDYLELKKEFDDGSG